MADSDTALLGARALTSIMPSSTVSCVRCREASAAKCGASAAHRGGHSGRGASQAGQSAGLQVVLGCIPTAARTMLVIRA